MKDSKVLVECPIVKTVGDSFPLTFLLFLIDACQVEAETRRRTDSID